MREILFKAANLAQNVIKNAAPFHTGNLRYNAVRLTQNSKNQFIVSVDTKIAPYMPYTNEPWISDRWRGKKNPNQNWWDNAAHKAAQAAAQALGGTVRRSK